MHAATFGLAVGDGDVVWTVSRAALVADAVSVLLEQRARAPAPATRHWRPSSRWWRAHLPVWARAAEQFRPVSGLAQGWQVTELADPNIPGALEAVDGVLAQVDSGAVTAGEAIELVLNAGSRCATTKRSRSGATGWRPSICVVFGVPEVAVAEARAK